MEQGRGGIAMFNRLLGFPEPQIKVAPVAQPPRQNLQDAQGVADFTETQVVLVGVGGENFRVAFWENLVNPEYGVGSTKFRALWFNLNLVGNAAQDSHVGIITVPRDLSDKGEVAERIIATMLWRAKCRVAVSSARTEAQMLAVFSYTMLPDQRWKPCLYVPTRGGKLAEMRYEFWSKEVRACESAWIWQGKNLDVDKGNAIFKELYQADNSFFTDSQTAVAWRFNYLREQLEREIKGK